MAHGRQDVDTVAEDKPTVADISKNLSWVVPGIDEILEDTPQLTFEAADVYAACMNGSATLWTTADGFVVTTGEIDAFTGDRTYLIWLAWAKVRGNNLVVKHQDFFISHAKEEGYKYIEVRSAVPELASYVISNGWEVDTVVYTREL